MGRFDNLKGFTLCLAVTIGTASTGSYIGKDALLQLSANYSTTTEDHGFGRIAPEAHTTRSAQPYEPTHSLQDLEAYETEQRRMHKEYQAYLSRMRPILLSQRCKPLPQPKECYDAGLGLRQ